MKSAGQWAEPCWTSSWSGVWPSGVLRCDVSDLVSWKRPQRPGTPYENGLTRLAAGGFRLPGPLSHPRFPLLRPPLRRRVQPIALRQGRSFVPGACPYANLEGRNGATLPDIILRHKSNQQSRIELFRAARTLLPQHREARKAI